MCPSLMQYQRAYLWPTGFREWDAALSLLDTSKAISMTVMKC